MTRFLDKPCNNTPSSIVWNFSRPPPEQFILLSNHFEKLESQNPDVFSVAVVKLVEIQLFLVAFIDSLKFSIHLYDCFEGCSDLRSELLMSLQYVTPWSL